jgi:CheY-like chemotaxis protein
MSKILCIDDEADLLDDIAEEIELAGHIVIQAADGRAGIEAILKHKPDLVICDIAMPHMSGFQVLATVREDHPELGLMPFIFLSALADGSDVVDGLCLGADDYLTKPINFELLIGKVNAELRRAQRIKDRTQEDYVKLYKAFASRTSETSGARKQPGATQPPPLTISLVGSVAHEMWKVQKALEKVGHEVVAFTSGRSYSEKGLRPPAHAVFIWPDIVDASAAQIASQLPKAKCLRILVVNGSDGDANHANIDVDFRLTLPVSEKELIKRFYKWGAAKFAKSGQGERVSH